MGFFSRKKKKQEPEFRWMTINEALSRNKMKQGNVSFSDVAERCTECCEQFIKVREQLNDVKQEYTSVTECLLDMEKLDALPPELHQKIEDTAGTMKRLNDDRVKYQENEQNQLDPAQFLYLEQYEDKIPDELRLLKEQEQYQQLVNSDLRQLEGEKASILYEKEEGECRKRFLSKLAVVGVALLCLVFMSLFVLMEYTGIDMMIAFLVVGALALVLAAYIVVNLRKISYNMRLADARKNKSIQLLNRVKVKYVNCTNTIDYLYEKYHIRNSAELEAEWVRYVKIKDMQAAYRKNTELLESYQHDLIQLLANSGLEDPEVWVYQPEAILDSREMVEVRHHMNERRRKVRERLDYLNQNFDIVRTELSQLRESFPQYTDEIRAVMKKYGIR